MKKSKIFLPFFCMLFCLVFLFGVCSFLYSNTLTATANAGSSTVDEIWDSKSKKFLGENLNTLATKSGFSDIDVMVTEAANGTVKTSATLGDWSVTLGGMTWNPMYLSKDSSGNAILTLWLAVSSYTCTYSDATYSSDSSGQSFNGTSVYSNTYDGSYLRNYILGGSTTYTTKWGVGTGIGTNLNKTLMNRFAPFRTSGDIGDYVVSPSAVSWQMAEANWKNDPAWAGTSGAGTSANYPHAWTADKLWLPSMYEVYDGKGVNTTSETLQDTTGSTSTGGLWQTSATDRSNSTPSWLRSGYYSNYRGMYLMNSNGNSYYNYVDFGWAVRPALHLNLTSAAANAGFCTHEWGEWEVESEATCTTAGSQTRTCPICNETETKEIEIDPAAHKYGEWQITTPATCTTDGEQKRVCQYNDEHFETQTITAKGHTEVPDEAVAPTCTTDGKTAGSHCSVCNEIITAQTIVPALGHSPGAAATCTTPQKCTVCNAQLAPANGHTVVTDSAVAPTCTTTGKTAGAHCSACNEVITAQTVIPALGHSWAEAWTTDGSNHWHLCNNGCGEKGSNSAHNYKWVVDKEATVTETGLKHEECICGEKRNEGTEIPVVTCLHPAKVHHAAVAPTCVTAGSVEYWHCPDCNKDLDGSNLELTATVIPADPSVHNWGEWVQTVAPSYTADGEERRECKNAGCEHYETRAVAMLTKEQAVISGFEEFTVSYGDEIVPKATTTHGSVIFTYADELGGTYVATKPKNVGTYYVKATVEEGESWLGAEEIISFEITARAITVTINAASSVQGDPLEELTATITSGTLVDGDGLPYVLSTNADISVMGEYVITGECVDDNYNITFVDGVYIVSKKANDPEGGGEIDLPVDINVEFKVTQSQTANDYPEIEDGLKMGYWAQLWYRNEDGTLGDEFTDKMNCMLTLKIPTEIIEGIRGGEEINRDKIAAGLSVYYVDESGALHAVEGFKIAQKEDESWIVKFNYNAKFRAEIVFNAPAVDVGTSQEPEEKNGGIPWWVWLIVGLGGATVLGVVVLIIVVAKKKGNGGGNGGSSYDDAALKAKLAEQDEKLDRLIEITDGGFNDLVDDE